MSLVLASTDPSARLKSRSEQLETRFRHSGAFGRAG